MFTRDDNETFNGWPNWDTWNCHLWISSDEFLCFSARETRSPAELKAFCKELDIVGDGFNYTKVHWVKVWEAITD